MQAGSSGGPRSSRQRQYSSPLTGRPSLHTARSNPNFSSSLQALDLHPPGKVNLPSALASLRTHVLSYLSDLEARLELLDLKSRLPKVSSDKSAKQDEGAVADEEDAEIDDLDLSVEDVTAFVQRGIELLQNIRADVCSYLPDDFDFSPPTSDALRSRLNELDVRSKFPDLSDFDMPAMPTIDSLRTRLSEISPPSPLSYIPTLQAHLSALQAHVQDLPFSVPSSSTFPLPCISPPKVLSDLLTDLLTEDTEEAIEADIQKARREEEDMTGQVVRALEKSQDGQRLIRFDDLPLKWRNNEYVLTGYRFIPMKSWHLLLGSIFRFHNETLNIYTHLIPLLTLFSLTWPYLPNILPPLFGIMGWNWSSPIMPTLIPSNPDLDVLPSTLFVLSAGCCLLCSVVWHLFAGCSDDAYVDSAARGDYIGIGWLISASVQSVVYYGFNCQTTLLRLYTGLCILTGLAGSVVPFQAWFNERRNKKMRIMFFLGLCFASILPLTHLSLANGPIATFFFVLPVIPSCCSYVVGLLFYASHFPESHFPGRFDWGSSHTLWHVFIVLAIRSHYLGLGELKVESAVFSCSP